MKLLASPLSQQAGKCLVIPKGEGTNGAQGAAQNLNGNNWLELGNAMGQVHQTYAIERSVNTRAGIAYDLNFNYAGRLGLDINHTRTCATSK